MERGSVMHLRYLLLNNLEILRYKVAYRDDVEVKFKYSVKMLARATDFISFRLKTLDYTIFA